MVLVLELVLELIVLMEVVVMMMVPMVPMVPTALVLMLRMVLGMMGFLMTRRIAFSLGGVWKVRGVVLSCACYH